MQGFGSNSGQPQPQPVRASQGLIAPEAFSALSCSMMRVDLKILSRFSDANSLQQSSSELPIEEIVPIEEIAWCKTRNCSCESCKDQQAPVQKFCAPRSLPFKTLINSVAVARNRLTWATLSLTMRRELQVSPVRSETTTISMCGSSSVMSSPSVIVRLNFPGQRRMI